MEKNIKSFTLIELIIVIIILGILAAIAIPMYTNAVEQRKGEVCINNIRTILAAWRIYNMNHTPYATVSMIFYPLNDINTTIGTSVDERNFGEQPPRTRAGFYMRYIQLAPLAPSYYAIHAYRLSGPYKDDQIVCEKYYPNGSNGNGTGIFYDWEQGNPLGRFWPWMPPDE